MQIKKTTYSKGKWRLFTEDGREVYTWQEIESTSGTVPCQGPVCGDTKEECLQACLSLLDRLWRMQ